MTHYRDINWPTSQTAGVWLTHSLTHTKYINPFKPIGYLMYVPPGLALKNSTLCPHSVFVCFVWISEQTAIILYTALINRFITQTNCLLRGKKLILKWKSDYS
jgi:hypothetical protein